MKTTAPCYLVPGSNAAEFMTIDNAIICYTNGKSKVCYTISDIPGHALDAILSHIDSNPKYQVGLRLMCGDNVFRQIYKFIECKLSGHDQFCDVDETGNVNEEFISCEKRGHCIGEKYICKHNKYSLTRREIEIASIIATDKADKQVADIIGTSQFTVRKHINNIGPKIETETKIGIAKFAIEHNLKF